jgi:hypothetical protein
MLHCIEMGRAVILTAILALALCGADKKKKPPEVTILECNGRRDAGKITLDGKVRNTGEKPLNGLLLLFDFLSSDKVILTTQKGPVEDEVLDPGQESTFHLQCEQPPRAVRFQLNAVDHSGRDLRVANAGPFAID